MGFNDVSKRHDDYLSIAFAGSIRDDEMKTESSERTDLDSREVREELGKMIVKQASLETDLAHLMRSYSKDNPEVKRARRRVEIFDAAINEILR